MAEGLTQVRNRLWTPDGPVPTQKDVHLITKRQIVALSVLHELAQEYGLSLVCKRCDTAVLGRNDGHERKASVACQCREFLFPGD